MIFLHYLYWIFIFTAGLMQLLEIPSAVYKVGVPAIALFLFFDILLRKKNNFFWPYKWWVLGFIFISFFSAIINQQQPFLFVYFLSYTLQSYLYFLVIINDRIFHKYYKITRLIKYLFGLQIFAGIIKFILVGQSEHGSIGTIALQAGAVSTLLPLFAITIIFSLYLYKKKPKYVFYIILFLFFGIIGMKRAIFILIPLFILIVYIYYNILINRKKLSAIFSFRFVFVLLAGLVMLILVAKTNPTLNPQGSNWGDVDLNFIYNYTVEYNQDKGPDVVTRPQTIPYFTAVLLSKSFQKLLLGDGAGNLIESKYNENNPDNSGGFYGVQYYYFNGYSWLVLQVGLLGVIIFLSFFLFAYKFVLENMRNNPFYIAFLCLTLLFFFDTFFYSTIFLTREYVKGIYFLIFGIIYVETKTGNDISSQLLKLFK